MRSMVQQVAWAVLRFDHLRWNSTPASFHVRCGEITGDRRSRDQEMGATCIRSTCLFVLESPAMRAGLTSPSASFGEAANAFAKRLVDKPVIRDYRDAIDVPASCSGIGGDSTPDPLCWS